MRLNKYLSEAGVCSRREADRLVQEGRILIDGEPAALGTQVEDSSRILIDGKKSAEKRKRCFWFFINPEELSVPQTCV